MLNKRHELRVAIAEHEPKIICILEVVPKNCRLPTQECELNIDSYKCFANLSPGKRGVCIYMHDSMEATECTIMTENEDSVWCEVRLTGNDKLLVGCVYRSPSCGEATDTKFNRTLQKANSSGYSHVLVCGDFTHPQTKLTQLHSSWKP